MRIDYKAAGLRSIAYNTGMVLIDPSEYTVSGSRFNMVSADGSSSNRYLVGRLAGCNVLEKRNFVCLL